MNQQKKERREEGSINKRREDTEDTKEKRKEEEVRTETPFLSESDGRQSRGFVVRIKKLLDRSILDLKM